MVTDEDEGQDAVPRGIVDLSHVVTTRAVCTYLLCGFVGIVRLEVDCSCTLAVLEMTARKARRTRTQKKTESSSGLLSPPSSTGDKAGDHDAAGPSLTVISTPSEEDEGQRSKVC